MNLDQIGELGSGASKRRGERLPQFERLVELFANEVDQVRFAGDEAVVGVDVTARRSRIVPQARGEAAGGCAAKRSEVYHSAFPGIGIPSQLVEQLALFQAEQA